jgi:hypothetical protein
LLPLSLGKPTVRKPSLLLVVVFGSIIVFFSSICTNSNIVAYAQTISPSSPSTDSGYPTIQIVSPHDGQLIPPGELTIQGISSDNEETDCQVYADVNDVTPMRDVAAAGDSGQVEDFSKWTFTYTQDYQLIKDGENELTAKISCVDDQTVDLNPFPASSPPSNSPLSEWHTINVTGAVGAPSVSLPLPTVGNTEGLTEEDDDSDGESNEEENDELEEDDDSDNDSGGSEGDDSNDEEDANNGDEDENEDDDDGVPIDIPEIPEIQ